MVVQFAPSRYAQMTREQLIIALERHDQTLQAIYDTVRLSNEKMAPGEKLFWIAARSVLANEKPNGKGLKRLPTDKIAESTGMSESSIGRYANALIERYSATKVAEPYVTKKGQDRTLTYVDHNEPVWINPWAVDIPEEKERVINGNGKQCPRCLTNNLQVTTRRITYQEIQECSCCNYRKVSAVQDDNDPLPPSEYIPSKLDEMDVLPKGLQPEEPFWEEEEEEQKALTSAPAYGPSIPPAPQDFSVSQKAPQPEEPFSLQPLPEIEKQAAQLLLSIAGEHSDHIQMSTKPDSGKYFTVASPLTQQDMLNHLQGTVTKGFIRRSMDGMTRAICIDADTPEEWQRVQEAARLLAIMDFKPLLIPSPVRGGKHKGSGHMWNIFDADVDAYSAIQTIYQYTGSLLRDIKDMWPGSTNIRMPGGKYVTSDFAAWCNLYDANMQELSHDGTGPALALLTHQTPADVVIEQERPEPTPAPVDAKANSVGGYLEKRGDGTTLASVLADFEARTSWDEIAALCGGWRGKYFSASWRGDKNPNVSVASNTDKAKDFSTNAWLDKAMDKYQVWCLIHGGANHEAWRKADLAQRCKAWEVQHGIQPQKAISRDPQIGVFGNSLFPQPVTPVKSLPTPFSENGLPTRMTLCCNVPFQWGMTGKPECSNPLCLEKQQEQIAS